MNEKYYLRYAKSEDVNMLFEWANDGEVRKNSFCSDLITYEQHVEWFARLLNDDKRRQYILVFEGKDVGQARVEVRDKEAIVSYSIAPSCRFKGYGNMIISLLPSAIKRDFSYISKIYAEVKTDNEISKKVFRNNNFKEKCVVFEMNI